MIDWNLLASAKLPGLLTGNTLACRHVSLTCLTAAPRLSGS